MNRGLVNLLPLFLLLFLGVSSCSKKEERRILVVHSYEESYDAYPDFNRMIAEQFKKEKVDADIRIVYLDCESYWEEPELARMRFLVDSISQGWKPEIILVNEDQAAYSLMKCNVPLAKEIPVVFGGVNYPNWGLLKYHPNVTGFHDKIAFNENVEVAKTLFGSRVRMFTMLDTTYIDRKIRADAKEQFQGHKVTGFIDSSTVSPEEQVRLSEEEGYTRFMAIPLRNSRNQSDANLMWVLNKNYRDQCYIQLKRDFTTINIGSICVSPSLTAINEAFGYGEKLLGGYMTTLPIQVEEEVKTAVRILNGERPQDIPISESRKEYVVDWKTMKQIGLSKDKIPANYTIVNIPFSDEYPLLWGVTVASLFLFLIILLAYFWWLYLREQARKKQALAALADEKENLSLAIEGGTTYVWKLDKEHFIFEDAFWKAQGLTPKPISFHELLNFVHPDHWGSVKLSWQNLKNARKRIAHVRCNFDGKEYQWWEFRYTTTMLPGGEYRTAGLLLNVQEIKDRERELEAARLLAEKAELKQSFLANMSHEIRTPLNSIVGFANILAVDEALSTEERQEYIDTINKNSELLLKLINDILELSRIESGYMSFTYQRCRVKDLIDDIYMTHQVLIAPRLDFLKETNDLPLEINVDRERLIQVLTNFLNNAGKFTEKGYIKLGYDYLPNEGKVLIYVEDTGRGIPQEEQRMIFSRFYKQNEFSQGAGLGLSICQVIIEKLGGKITLQSEAGKGSRFTVILPCWIES